MKENEAIRILGDTTLCTPLGQAAFVGIEAIKKVQQYRAIGTVEECREAKERQTPKTPNIWGDGCDDKGNMIYDMWDCPNCNESYELDYHNYRYCPKCGQAIDWHGIREEQIHEK